MTDIRQFFKPDPAQFKLRSVFTLFGTNAALLSGQMPFKVHDLAKQAVEEAELHFAFRQVSVGGCVVRQTRRTAFFGITKRMLGYSYSGQTTEVILMPEKMRQLLVWVNSKLKTRFNGVLFNHYPAGDKNGIGFHADQSPDPQKPLGNVAALSIGGSRCFRLKDRVSKKTLFDLETRDGQLMVMAGTDFQKRLMHGIPARKGSPERWSITFRQHPLT